MESLITTRQLADLWCQTPRWVLRMVKDHDLPHYLLGGAVRYRVSEVEVWLQRHRRGQAIQGAAESTSTPIPRSVDLRPVADTRGAV